MKILVAVICLSVASMGWMQAQHWVQFEDEIKDLKKTDNQINTNNLVLFTGSSSIRMWSTLADDFDGTNTLNRGFGGSRMSDLLHFYDQLILPYRPSKVFIYEGDNDLSADISIDDILKDAKELTSKIQSDFPGTTIHFISPKPSISRWHLKEQYEQLNYQLGLWTLFKSGVEFIDVWTPMLEDSGEVQKDLFIEDGLHMNARGYKIWKDVIAPYVED